MSSVTRLHLLNQSMLNVSCQKQKHCRSLPTDSLTESPMEFVGQSGPSRVCNLLGVPGLSTLDGDSDEGDVVIGIRPKSSPLPWRRSSVSDEDSEPEPPLCGSRRVSFADAKGLSLVRVKEFDARDVPTLPAYDSSEGEGKDAEEYFLSPLTFSLPLSNEELFVKVREQKVELETIELLPGTTILKGVIRVLNISFTKAVYVRTTLDTWSSHFDLLAEYIPGSSDGLMDSFSFKLTLVPPFGEQGARVDFCLRYETSVGTFWTNNNNRNYVLFCHQRVKERKEKPQKENVNKKSCLKTVGPNFSTVENISSMEASSQENITTDVSKYGEKVDTMKAKQISDGQSGTSEEAGQKVLTESRQNCSRRSHRKAARMAHVRDYFAQRDGGVNNTERDEVLPEAKQEAHETPEEKHSDVQSFSEERSKSEGCQFVSESLETCSEPLLDVLHDTSPAHNYASNSEPEKSESINLADSATLTGGESATDIPDNPLHSNHEPVPAERQDINKSISKAEGSCQKQGMSYECAGNIAAEPVDNVISAVSSESLISQKISFTFGTVVAPLYCQVFGRAGSGNQSVVDRGKPVRATRDLTQSYPHTERRETSCTFPTDVRCKTDRVQENVIKTQESNEEFLDATPNSPPIVELKASLSVTANDILEHAETLQDPVELIHSDPRRTNTSEVPKTNSGDTVVHQHTVNTLNTDLLNPQISTESSHLQGEAQEEAQEDNLTRDLQSQTTAETAQAQVPEHACTQIKTNVDEPLVQNETQEVITSLESPFTSLQPSQSVSVCVSDERVQQTSGSRANNYKCVDESIEDNDVGKTVTISTTNGISEEDKLLVALHDLNPNHINNSATTETENSNVSCFEIVKDVITLHFCLADTSELKNWEMMVEEEEKNTLTDEEESEAIRLKAEDIEAVEKDQGEQLEDARIETGLENRDTTETEKKKTEEEMVGEITAARETENKVEDADVLVNKMRIGEEELAEIEEEKREGQENTELENEKHCAEIREVNIERTHFQEEGEIEGEEEMETDLNDEAGVEREDQVKPREANVEEENADHKEEILVDETGDSEIVDAESESKTIQDRENEVGCFEERLDIIQNTVEDGLSALVNNVQAKRIIDKENTGEGQNAHLPTEMHLYKVEDFQSNENVTYDLSKAVGDENKSAAVEGRSCIFADEPESDQTGHGSASAESDSDDEVELYMHRLRAVHTGAQPHKDRNKDTGFSVGTRSSVSRSKRLSTTMPPISESLDEEQQLSRLQDNHEDTETADIQPTAVTLPAPRGQESINSNVSWWIETFSCRNISKTLLYATLLVVFLVVAYHYDFLACFGLYLISVIWLYCQGERQPAKNNNRVG